MNQEKSLHKAIIEKNLPLVHEILHVTNANAIEEVPEWLNDRWTPLICAAHVGQLEICRALIAQGANVDGKNKLGDTALHMAAKMGHAGICAFLIEQKANASICNNLLQTPIDVAAISGHTEVFLFLLDMGLKILPDVISNCFKLERIEVCSAIISRGLCTTEDLEGFLFKAVDTGNVSMCEMILGHGLINVDCYDGKSGTSLHKAAYHGHLNVCELLVDRFRANVNAVKLESRYTPLHDACRNLRDRVDICEFLIKRGANALTGSLRIAAANCNERVCRLLLDNGADVNALPDDMNLIPCSALGVVSARLKGIHELKAGEIDHGTNIIMMFLNRGAILALGNIGTSTLLHDACMCVNFKLCKFLIERGADVNAVITYGQETPLHTLFLRANIGTIATRYQADLIAIFELFINNGFDVNATDRNGRSILHDAVELECAAVCKLLLEHGAHTESMGRLRFHKNARSSNELLLTPLQIAVDYGNAEICKLLIDHGANVQVKTISRNETLLDLASMKGAGGSEEILRMLLETGRIAASASALAHSVNARQISPTMIKMLVEAGANVHARNGHGRTILHQLSIDRHFDLCRLLVKHGADINKLGYDGSNPLHDAVSKLRPETCKFLLDLGADPNFKTEDDVTPIQLLADTRKKGSAHIRKLLFSFGAACHSAWFERFKKRQPLVEIYVAEPVSYEKTPEIGKKTRRRDDGEEDLGESTSSAASLASLASSSAAAIVAMASSSSTPERSLPENYEGPLQEPPKVMLDLKSSGEFAKEFSALPKHLMRRIITNIS